jgi:hypothetical protein
MSNNNGIPTTWLDGAAIAQNSNDWRTIHGLYLHETSILIAIPFGCAGLEDARLDTPSTGKFSGIGN